jgi:tripartite-type tricarboxylate transporter receptor subunit TctC
MLGQVQADQHLLARVLWPVLVLAVLAFVVSDFVRHPFLGAASEAAVAPQAHLTLWLPETEATGEAGPVVRETADSLLLYGRPATVGTLAGGSAQAVTRFLSHRQAADELLAVSSETLSDLAQERISALPGEDPLRAALAQRLLARAVPVAVLGGEPLAIAVLPGSPIHGVAQLLDEMRSSAQAHVFAITDDNWATDNLAALVQDTGVNGVVPYRVYPSPQTASLALTAGEADVVIAPRGALRSNVRAHRLRALAWPLAMGPPPRLWVELLAAPGTPAASVAVLRRQLRALRGNRVWRALLHEQGGSSMETLSGTRLRGFLERQIAQTGRLQQLALRVELHY